MDRDFADSSALNAISARDAARERRRCEKISRLCSRWWDGVLCSGAITFFGAVDLVFSLALSADPTKMICLGGMVLATGYSTYRQAQKQIVYAQAVDLSERRAINLSIISSLNKELQWDLKHSDDPKAVQAKYNNEIISIVNRSKHLVLSPIKKDKSLRIKAHHWPSF